MSKRETGAAWEYHNATKHSPQSVRASGHRLDWANQPIPYKIYTSLAPIPLPRDLPPSTMPALDAIAASGEAPEGERVPDLATVARLCFFSNGVTRRLSTPRGPIDFRAAACTGALYHIELYLVCGDLPGLAAGVYHYGAHDNSLRALRTGDYRAALVEATGREPAVAAAPLVIVSTSTFWRNAWKYQARAYRHSFWDDGTLLANLLAVAAAAQMPARLALGFADGPVNQLLDVDGEREAAISMVAVGRTAGTPPPVPPIAPLGLPTLPLSRREVDYPAIRAMHAASSLASGAEAAEWRAGPPYEPPSAPAGGPLIPLQPLAPSELPSEPIESVILRRGSTRRFSREPITLAQLSAALDRATRVLSVDGPAGADWPSDLYLNVNAVEGLAPGAYAFRRQSRALELLKRGDFRATAGMLALDQELGADAAVNIYFLSDLESVLARFGNRGYRLAQLVSAIRAGKLYLAVYALGFGATGLTFYDDEVTAFFAPDAAGKSVMFLVALGRPVRRT